MATTSPDNLRTPDPGDPYNLVPDLATLANDVQAALNARDQNVLKGTGAQRAVAESTATEGMLWVDTDGIRMIWRRGVSNWEPAVWQWSGAASQMNNFTQAPNGFKWYNTTDNSDYVRVGGAWSRFTEVMQSGTQSFSGTITSGTRQSATVTFSPPFKSPPKVHTPFVTENVAFSIQVRHLTAESMSLSVFNPTSGTIGVTPVHWSVSGQV